MRHPALSPTFSPPRSSGRVAAMPAPGALATPVPARTRPADRSLPHPSQLAALGTVLCLSPAASGSELAGWSHAVRLAAQSQMDSDGLRESLWFFDAGGRCCWRLHLLPDSDFLAWDRLASVVPRLPAQEPGGGIGERLWRRLAHRVRGDAWRMGVVRLHALGRLGDDLAASPAPLSALGAGLLRRIAQAEGLDLPGPAIAHDGACNGGR
ncbi:Hemin transport protein [[Pseudomonas] boreopolis]|uniref:Hemin transport protein n=1 Tax=Xanthomonas boreopolis TaxID=86183 RepID=A0A919F4R1_9XANT|nr:hypothetical protein GCM10009090_03550 [[Pseudomonas] boreopolis]